MRLSRAAEARPHRGRNRPGPPTCAPGRFLAVSAAGRITGRAGAAALAIALGGAALGALHAVAPAPSAIAQGRSADPPPSPGPDAEDEATIILRLDSAPSARLDLGSDSGSGPGAGDAERAALSIGALPSVSEVTVLGRLGYAIVRAAPSALEDLRAVSGVRLAWYDRIHRLPAEPSPQGWPAPSAGATWSLTGSGVVGAWDLGVLGEGAVVALLDSGASWSHPLLRDTYRGGDGVHDHDWIDLAQDVPARAPIDTNGHGTHVLGSIVGRAGGETWGVAPGARWIAARVFDGAGRSTDSRLLLAAEWLLAPTALDGSDPRPDLAPDVINASWTLESGADPLFADILDAWRRAGIVAVFAAGNDTEGSGTRGTVRMPGAHEDALSVGALDIRGNVWRMSRGGPAFDGRIKPDLVAPGVDVLSADFRGGTNARTGTSMAAAHVSGAAALLRSARPDFAPEAVAAFLRAHARDGGDAGPDMVYGWGALDAGAAVAAALRAGRISGIVRRADGTPLPGARIVAARPGVTGTAERSAWDVRSGADGRFELPLPDGRWTMDVTAAGFVAERRAIDIAPRGSTELDVALLPAAGGRVVGTVRSSRWGPLVGARIGWSDPGDAGSLRTATDVSGTFGLDLPAGRRIVHVTADGHRAITLGLEIRPGDAGALDVELDPVPRIAIVDADAYRDERIWPYIERALADGGYSADVLTIDRPSDAPSARTLDRYDVVFWLQGVGSPGSIDRERGDDRVVSALTGYARRGGRLVVAGRSIGAWDAEDGPPSNRFAPELFRDVLGARLARIYAAPDSVLGSGPLAGLALDLRSPIGRISAERATGEAIVPAPGRPEGEVVPLLRSGDEIHGVAVDDAFGRRAFLAIGLERAGGRAALRELFDRLLEWLDVPAVAFEPDDPAPLTRARPIAAPLALFAGRSAIEVRLTLELPDGVEPGASLGGLTREGDVLAWRGALGAGSTLRFAPELALDPDAGTPGGTRIVTATVTSGGKVVTATRAITITAPDLRPSRLVVSPARLRSAGPVALEAHVVNAGWASSAARVRFDDVPPEFVPDPTSLRATDGDVRWEADVAAWSGVVAPGTSTVITLEGRLDPSARAPSPMSVDLSDAYGFRVRLAAEARVGGPDLILGLPDGPAPIELDAGTPMTVPLTIQNAGDARASVNIEIRGPDGVEIEPRTAHGLEVAAGESRPLLVRLSATGAAADGALSIGLDDGLRPRAPTSGSVPLVIRGPDPGRSTLVFDPPAARAGATVTGSLLVANHGSAVGAFESRLSLPPALVVEPGSVRASAGTASASAGGIEWAVGVEPARATYRSVPGTARERPPDGDPLGAVDPSTGLRGPVPLGFAFPMATRVITQAWLSDAGLVVFEPAPPPMSRAGLEALEGAAIAIGWNDATAPLDGPPRVARATDRMTLTWRSADPEAWSSASLESTGRIALAWGPERETGADFGLRQAGGAIVRPDPGMLSAGAVDFVPPGGWVRLVFRARLASSQALDTEIVPRVALRWAGVERAWGVPVRVNPIRRDHSALSIVPAAPSAGGSARYSVRVGADGDFDPREFTVELVPPEAATIIAGPMGLGPGSGRPGIWSGRLGPGEVRTLVWDVSLRTALAPRAPLFARASIGARGWPARSRTAFAEIAPPGRHTVTIVASPRMPMPGESVSIRVDIAEREEAGSPVALEVQVPPGLTLDAATLGATDAPAPRWDAAMRVIRWSGDVRAGRQASIVARGRYDGAAGQRLTLVATAVDVPEGTASAWIDIIGAADRVQLPFVASDRPANGSGTPSGAAKSIGSGVTHPRSSASIPQRHGERLLDTLRRFRSDARF